MDPWWPFGNLLWRFSELPCGLSWTLGCRHVVRKCCTDKDTATTDCGFANPEHENSGSDSDCDCDLGTYSSGSDLTPDDDSQPHSDSDGNSDFGGACDSGGSINKFRDGEPRDNEEVGIVWAKANKGLGHMFQGQVYVTWDIVDSSMSEEPYKLPWLKPPTPPPPKPAHS